MLVGVIILRKIFKLVLVLIVMVFIFAFSNESGVKSTKRSDRVITVFFKNNRKTNRLITFVRKSAHFIIYFLLGFLVINLFIEFNLSIRQLLVFSLLFCFIYACSDEIHQLFIVGRSGSFVDVLLDTISSFLGIIFYKSILFRARRSMRI